MSIDMKWKILNCDRTSTLSHSDNIEIDMAVEGRYLELKFHC